MLLDYFCLWAQVKQRLETQESDIYCYFNWSHRVLFFLFLISLERIQTQFSRYRFAAKLGDKSFAFRGKNLNKYLHMKQKSIETPFKNSSWGILFRGNSSSVVRNCRQYCSTATWATFVFHFFAQLSQCSHRFQRIRRTRFTRILLQQLV